MVNPNPKYDDKRRYVRVEHGGTSCICTPENATDMIEDNSPGGPYTFTDVWMTKHEFEQLPDFQGF